MRAFHLESFALCEGLEFCPTEPRLCAGAALYTGNLPIPDYDPKGVTLDLRLTDAAGSPLAPDNVVGLVEVALTIRHTYPGDLQIDLLCPGGTVVPLWKAMSWS